jgi:hypothetical protein
LPGWANIMSAVVMRAVSQWSEDWALEVSV